MNPFSDDFISYENDFVVKQEKISDHDVSLGSPFSVASESTAFYQPFISPVLRSMLDSDNLTLKDPFNLDFVAPMKRPRPFNISNILLLIVT